MPRRPVHPLSLIPSIAMSDASPPYRPRCIHLTCKSMMVYGEAFENDPEYQAGMTEFTCTCTFQPQGPDGGDT